MAVDESVSAMVHRPSRLRALASLEANAESSAEALDRIARVACRVLDVPVVLVNLIGAERQHFVGCGASEPWASMTEMPLTAGFCPFALGAAEAYSLTDARLDSALAVNPAVEHLGVVAYAGVPLRAADGEPIGTLCAIDYEPREWSPEDLAALSDSVRSGGAAGGTAGTSCAIRSARIRRARFGRRCRRWLCGSRPSARQWSAISMARSWPCSGCQPPRPGCCCCR